MSGVEPEGDDYPPEYDDDFDLGDCWNCSGEGFVSSCFEEWACMYPDEGCDLCTRLCEICQPTKPGPQGDAHPVSPLSVSGRRDEEGSNPETIDERC